MPTGVLGACVDARFGTREQTLGPSGHRTAEIDGGPRPVHRDALLRDPTVTRNAPYRCTTRYCRPDSHKKGSLWVHNTPLSARLRDKAHRSESAQPEQEKRRLFARSKPKKKKGPDLELAQTYNFNLREEGSRKHHVQCRTVFGRNYKGSFLGGSVTQDQTILSCELSSDAAGAQPDRVDMAVGKRDLPGAASLHGTDFRIVAEYKKAGQGDGPLAITGLNPLGYVMYRDDEAVAAVQTVKERAVWMSDDLKPEVRSRVAAALMAMAYYMPIEPT